MSKLHILDILTPARSTGNLGEKYAARYLRKQGCRILERNYVAADHEIDLVADEGDTVLFVEVKTRTVGHENPNEPRPASAVDVGKRKSIVTAAKCYLTTHRPEKKARFDIVEVYLADGAKEKTPRVDRIVHMKGAFTADDARLPYPKNRKARF